ncbi:phosphoglycolate phosphatase [Stygiolobus caldivivus]|uniref:Phosphoglycolate phosphatase n=1 Tax=Stygiolobus caldivivus TaxID=2824673 RepID=A0A8D5U9F3_9CREN|nr:phosphoglycolate phosphatase [Stygiolobus caldivivus]BCU71318.1 phosphoglycolate phosphatase [Stygiolobus caldivivus]
MRLILVDVDGTLTLDRDTYLLELDAIKALREIQKSGFKVGIVSGNSYPVLRALYTYLGFNGGIVAENGCVVYYEKLYEVCEKINKDLIAEFERLFNVKGSWQNVYKCCDLTFTPPYLTNEMVKWAKGRGLYIRTSGYAIHVSKSKKGKGDGVRFLISLLGVSKGDVIGIGDSSTDIEFLEEVGFKVVVGNGEEEVKKLGNYITREKSGKGVVEFVNKLIKGDIDGGIRGAGI